MTSHRKQRGVVLLILMLVLLTGTTSYYLSALNKRPINTQRKEEVLKEMGMIKEALLAYAASTHDIYEADSGGWYGPGRLPFPDGNNDGTPCGTSSGSNCIGAVGRLPEYVNLPDGNRYFFSNKYSGTDQQFWYQVTGDFLTESNEVNTSTATTITVDGSPVVAVLIAPGEAVSGQDRTGNSANYLPDNHLELANGSSTNTYLTADNTQSGQFNDIVIPITSNEIMTQTSHRVAIALKNSLDQFYENNFFWYPWNPSIFNEVTNNPYSFWYTPVGNWYIFNDWGSEVTYTFDWWTAKANIQFNNCNIQYSFSYGSDISLSQKNC